MIIRATSASTITAQTAAIIAGGGFHPIASPADFVLTKAAIESISVGRYRAMFWFWGFGRRSMVMLGVALMVLVAIVYAARPQDSSFLRPAGSPSSCALQMTGHDVTVYFAAPDLDVQSSCANLIRVFAGAGELWNESGSYVSTIGGIPRPTDTADTIVCSLRHGSETVLVWDSGGAIYGQQVCEAYLSSNWVESGT